MENLKVSAELPGETKVAGLQTNLGVKTWHNLPRRFVLEQNEFLGPQL